MEEHPLAKSTHPRNGEQSLTHAVLVDPPKRDWRFWFSFLAICISVFIAALELVRYPALLVPLFLEAQASLQTGVSTALPIIVDDLKGTEFLWAGSAYALAATAFIPFNGGLAEVIRMYAKSNLVLFHSGSFSVADWCCSGHC
jgi:hypothetical protein